MLPSGRRRDAIADVARSMGQALRVARKNRPGRGGRGVRDRSPLDSSEEPECRYARPCWPVGSPRLTRQPRGMGDAGFGHPPVAPLFRHSRAEMRDHRRTHSFVGCVMCRRSRDGV
jgi:hypothetical protein